ncbi:DUF2567 domain-containing protein [Tomitella fengzijianii]|uniref:DUF2567 domain-containing protein n=1 Tax=Tomitella fengzijianii TaxID=2597660 RepID=A0A516X437_9ACTN|nr:DUF2567 domain-containing protein [Tomitella fengzijianii]QDQ97842.1 DUF2567 domain-containing protein [Tomitella fengzijianii]
MRTFSPARGATLVGIGCALAGVLGGVVWGLLAPGRTQVVAHGGLLLSVDMSANHEFDALAIFVWISVVVGVVSGAAAWAWRSIRGPLTALAVIVGGVAGAWLAAGMGDLVAQSRFDWPGASELDSMVGQVVVQAPSVELWIALVMQPLAAGLVYLVAVLLAPDADLGSAAAHAVPSGSASLEPGVVPSASTPAAEPGRGGSAIGT